MTKEKVFSIIRHTLTFVGGILIANGLASESIVLELTGAVTTLVGGIWSIIEKN